VQPVHGCLHVPVPVIFENPEFWKDVTLTEIFAILKTSDVPDRWVRTGTTVEMGFVGVIRDGKCAKDYLPPFFAKTSAFI
jgi:hypothetical protein